MWPSTCRSTAIRDRRPISTGLSHRWLRGRPSRVAAAEDEPRHGVNLRAKRRKGFARVRCKHLDCFTAPAQRAQFFDYALAFWLVAAGPERACTRHNKPASISETKHFYGCFWLL